MLCDGYQCDCGEFRPALLVPVETLRDFYDRVCRLGPGADLDADPNDPSPEDAVSFNAGLLAQEIAALLKEAGHE
jgi:hypothetical protein